MVFIGLLASGVVGQDRMTEATRADLKRSITRRITIAPLSPAAKLGRAKLLAKTQPPGTVQISKLDSASLGSPLTFTLTNNKSVNASKYVGQLVFLGGDIGPYSTYDETIGVGKYVPGVAGGPSAILEWAPTFPGIYIFDLAADSAYVSLGKVKISIDGPGAYDTQPLTADGHVLFLVNLKQIDPTGTIYGFRANYPWTFKSIEISQFK